MPASAYMYLACCEPTIARNVCVTRRCQKHAANQREETIDGLCLLPHRPLVLFSGTTQQGGHELRGILVARESDRATVA
jgi:hypothetical protein